MSDPETNVETTPAGHPEIDRRQMLARLGATGLVGAGLAVSGGWRKPVVQAAYLPPHAQISPAPTSTVAPAPTATLIPTPTVHTIVSCDWVPDSRQNTVTISPADADISMTVQVYDLFSATPTVPVENATYMTDASGQATHEYTLGGCPMLRMVWSFTDSDDGTDTCTTSDYEPPC